MMNETTTNEQEQEVLISFSYSKSNGLNIERVMFVENGVKPLFYFWKINDGKSQEVLK
jgi:hypothetical protein